MLTKHKSANTKDRENNENAIQIQKIFKKKEEPLRNNWSFNIGFLNLIKRASFTRMS